ELGLVLLEPDDSRSDICWYAINQVSDSANPSQPGAGQPGSQRPSRSEAVQPSRSARQEALAAVAHNTQVPAGSGYTASGPQGATYIPSGWQPGEEWLRHCRQHSIPDEFALGLVPGFVSYWRD